MAQCSQMRQTHDAASPNHPNAAGVLYADELLQVFDEIAGEYINGANQMEA